MSDRKRNETIETYRNNNICKGCKSTYYYLGSDGYVIVKCRHNVAICLLNDAMHFAYRKPGEEIIKSDAILLP